MRAYGPFTAFGIYLLTRSSQIPQTIKRRHQRHPRHDRRAGGAERKRQEMGGERCVQLPCMRCCITPPSKFGEKCPMKLCGRSFLAALLQQHGEIFMRLLHVWGVWVSSIIIISSSSIIIKNIVPESCILTTFTHPCSWEWYWPIPPTESIHCNFSPHPMLLIT